MHFKNTAFGKVLASSVAACMATTSLHAIPKGPCDQQKAPDVCCEEPKPGPFGFAFPMDMGIACPRDFYVRVEGLAFQAKEGGMEFGVIDSTGVGSSSPLTNGKVSGFSNDHSDWDWNPGMRFGMGLYLDHDAWNLDFAWTWLNITDYKRANANSASGVVLPMWLTGTNVTTLGFGPRCSAVWDTSYNTFDIRLAKPYHVSRYVIFNPHFGVRAAWIDQHFSVDYGGGSMASRSIHHGNNDFWGVGARAGLETDWMLGKGWCLFGNIASSMLFGKFNISQEADIPSAVSADSGYNIDYDFYQNVPNMEIALGIGWGRHFDKNRYHIGIRAAYEFHQWWDQFNMRRFWSGANAFVNDVTARGDLTLNGFSLKVQLDI